MDKTLLLALAGVLWIGVTTGVLGCVSFEGRSRIASDDSDFGGDAQDARGDGGEDAGEDEGGDDTTGNDNPDGGGETPDDGGETPDDGEPPAPDDAAEVVSVDLPSALDCGATYLASVEIRNLGQATWTRAAGYKLGAVDGSDPLYGPASRVWLDVADSVAPGETHVFEFQLTAPAVADAYLSDWQMVHEGVQWFGESTAATVAVACSAHTWCDPLTDASLRTGFDDKTIRGGSFSAAGWRSTDDDDQLLLRLTTPLSAEGSLEIDVTNFDPTTQYTGTKHQIVNMYTSDDGSQGVFATDEAWWNIRTGSNYGTGFKFLAAPVGGDSREEARLVASASWDPNDSYTFAVIWDAHTIEVYLDGTELQSLAFDGRVQPLQYVFIGKDNVFYDGQVGPIYSNLCVSNEPSQAP